LLIYEKFQFQSGAFDIAMAFLVNSQGQKDKSVSAKRCCFGIGKPILKSIL